MACCGLTYEYIYSKLDAGESNWGGKLYSISRDTLLHDIDENNSASYTTIHIGLVGYYENIQQDKLRVEDPDRHGNPSQRWCDSG